MTPWTVAHQPILQARRPEWVAIPFSRDLPDPGIEPGSLTLQADSYRLSCEGSSDVSDSLRLCRAHFPRCDRFWVHPSLYTDDAPLLSDKFGKYFLLSASCHFISLTCLLKSIFKNF